MECAQVFSFLPAQMMIVTMTKDPFLVKIFTTSPAVVKTANQLKIITGFKHDWVALSLVGVIGSQPAAFDLPCRQDSVVFPSLTPGMQSLQQIPVQSVQVAARSATRAFAN